MPVPPKPDPKPAGKDPKLDPKLSDKDKGKDEDKDKNAVLSTQMQLRIKQLESANKRLTDQNKCTTESLATTLLLYNQAQQTAATGAPSSSRAGPGGSVNNMDGVVSDPKDLLTVNQVSTAKLMAEAYPGYNNIVHGVAPDPSNTDLSQEQLAMLKANCSTQGTAKYRCCHCNVLQQAFAHYCTFRDCDRVLCYTCNAQTVLSDSYFPKRVSPSDNPCWICIKAQKRDSDNAASEALAPVVPDKDIRDLISDVFPWKAVLLLATREQVFAAYKKLKHPHSNLFLKKAVGHDQQFFQCLNAFPNINKLEGDQKDMAMDVFDTNLLNAHCKQGDKTSWKELLIPKSGGDYLICEAFLEKQEKLKNSIISALSSERLYVMNQIKQQFAKDAKDMAGHKPGPLVLYTIKSAFKSLANQIKAADVSKEQHAKLFSHYYAQIVTNSCIKNMNDRFNTQITQLQNTVNNLSAKLNGNSKFVNAAPTRFPNPFTANTVRKGDLDLSNPNLIPLGKRGGKGKGKGKNNSAVSVGYFTGREFPQNIISDAEKVFSEDQKVALWDKIYNLLLNGVRTANGIQASLLQARTANSAVAWDFWGTYCRNCFHNSDLNNPLVKHSMTECQKLNKAHIPCPICKKSNKVVLHWTSECPNAKAKHV